jgi:uncharacterized protein YaaQ
MLAITIICLLLSVAVIKKQDETNKELLKHLEQLKLRVTKLESRYEMMKRSERRGLSEL